METNKSIAITGENNLPELIQDKLGNTKPIPKNPRAFEEIAEATAHELIAATKKLSEAFENFKNVNGIR